MQKTLNNYLKSKERETALRHVKIRKLKGSKMPAMYDTILHNRRNVCYEVRKHMINGNHVIDVKHIFLLNIEIIFFCTYLYIFKERYLLTYSSNILKNRKMFFNLCVVHYFAILSPRLKLWIGLFIIHQ